MNTIPAVHPPLRSDLGLNRHIPPAAALHWLGAGWRDLVLRPVPSLVYGLGVAVVSAAIVYGILAYDWSYILFPALAGFMVVGPVLAIGLYEKSRRIAAKIEPTLASMVFVRPASGGQVVFTGLLLLALVLLWTRAAVILYALFFGLVAFPGIDHIATMLFTTVEGWALLTVGSLVGALFAGLSFAISVFAVPMMLDKQIDSATAMGTSVRLVWHNLPVMLAWGTLVLALFLLSLATGLIGLVVVFPLLGHGTWHAYRAVNP